MSPAPDHAAAPGGTTERPGALEMRMTLARDYVCTRCGTKTNGIPRGQEWCSRCWFEPKETPKKEDAMEPEGYLQDPERYKRCSQPHESVEAATAALAEFLQTVGDAREENQIAEVVIIALTKTEDQQLRLVQTWGDSRVAPQLIAAAYRELVAPLVAALSPTAVPDPDARSVTTTDID
jgi:hypothetical protein